jgi:paraquat-inducible protein A
MTGVGVEALATQELPTGERHGVYGCRHCGLVSRRADDVAASDVIDDGLECPRCGSALHHRRPGSLHRTWAFTLAAMLLYGPANLLPIMTTVTVFGTTQHTILGGIAELWDAGDWSLAVIVFVASIVVPLLKLFVLLLLAFTAQRRSSWCSPERAQLYRLLEAVGHWSMLDVFVVVLLVGMVQFGAFAGVRPEPGLLAFGAVVVLSVLATNSFDPRLIWPDARAHPA